MARQLPASRTHRPGLPRRRRLRESSQEFGDQEPRGPVLGTRRLFRAAENRLVSTLARLPGLTRPPRVGPGLGEAEAPSGRLTGSAVPHARTLGLFRKNANVLHSSKVPSPLIIALLELTEVEDGVGTPEIGRASVTSSVDHSE